MLIAAGVGSWTLIGPHTSYVTGLLPGIVIMSIGQGLAFTAMTAASLTGVPEARHGVAGGLNITTQQVGSGLGVAILATLAATATSPGPAGVLAGYHLGITAAALAGLAGALATFITLRRPRFTDGH